MLGEDFWWLVAVSAPPLEIAWVLVAATYIILQRRSAHATLAWIFALAFFPLFGILLYVVFGPRRFERRKKRRARALDAVMRTTRVDSHPSEEPRLGSQLVRMLERTVGRAGQPRRADLVVHYDGDAKYAALERAIAEAKRHIHLEYYIWEPDRVGTRLRDRLIERAKGGVEVRVLVDGFGSNKAHDRFWAPLREAGGQVRRFNELTLLRWRPRMVNFRTHRKIAVIDGEVGFTGGMNVADVHSREVSGDAAWRDTHVELRGPGVKGLQVVFFEDWHYAGGDAPEVDEYLPDIGPFASGDYLVQVVSSGPDEGLDAIHKLFFTSIAAAVRRVELTTPYFVPDETMLSALMSAALGGVDVTVLVPEGGDAPFVAAAARSYYPELLEAGVKIYEHRDPPVLHAKTLVVDDLAVIGTANTDTRSFRLNFEVVVAIHDPRVADALSQKLREDLERSRRVTLSAMRRAPLHRRLYSSTARLFSPLL
ncbi:MAG: cardiolipin synthase [Sandaracinaceae bacterium]|nr:cardiolipin synthase [Sandaracinaceae bacterium]